MVFDDVQRNDRSPGRYGETRFAFLNRSSTKYFGYVRDLIEDWVSHVPVRHQPDLVGALRAGNRQHEAAFWELYLHEGYRRSGYGIEIHPAIPGSTKTPDFLIDTGADRFYVEAVSVGASPDLIAEENRLQRVYSVLHEMRVENFMIGVHHYSIGPNALATKRLKSSLRSWLSGLDPERVYETYLPSEPFGLPILPEISWEDDGWSLVFEAFPMGGGPPGKSRPALGMMGPGEASLVDNATGIARVLDHKHGRYGVLEAPLVIAVQSNTTYPTHDYEVEQALYGVATRRPNDPTLTEEHFLEDGFWRTSKGWRRQESPQVISVHGLYPWSVASVRPRSWSTLAPGVAIPSQPTWISRMDVGVQSLPIDGDDPATHFAVEIEWLASDPDFDV